MKEIIFNSDKEYNKFEFLTGYENLEYNNTEFWNSMDYIIVDEPRESNVFIPDFIKLPGYFLNLYNSSTKELEEIFILRKDINKDYLDSLAHHIEAARLHAIDGKRYGRRVSNIRWALYYKIIKSFTSPIDLYYQNRLIRKKSFDYGYASSIHKSQGSSINNVFIDMKDTFKCRDKEELRQLQYVAISRAKKNAYILQ
jgi:superfamily I DNA/RNA helicase